jgi:hypothetical protein
MSDRKTYTAEDFIGKLGRNVLVEGKVVACYPDDGRHVTVCFGDGRWRVLASAIREILPQEIGVGDRVTCEGYTGRVLHIDGAFAWMQTRLGENLVVSCDACTIIEPAQ